MPLVDPVTMGTGSKDLATRWLSQVAGKKIGNVTDETTFAKSELPKEHRILKEGDMATMDHNPDRLNLHVDNDGTVKNVTAG
ncbi:hypothetical protein EV356DRAFT_576354 [Viridothelium virens]|uniref:Proteinase inhibitor I78 n=1 Tax=Viridothelium virens TaxID=1048519 RepID=A0A6A6HA74_VIRVR|nr:hypothetical protein EV356DRAFT_576354 [Viridothelium virens]